MHRYLYQVYTEDDTSRIQQATKEFRHALNQHALPSPPEDPVVLADVIAEYLMDTKQYSRSEYSPQKAKDLFCAINTLSNRFCAYIADVYLPQIPEERQRLQEDYQTKLQEYRQLYDQDRDYPIYVRSLGAREKRDKRLQELQQAQEVAEWLMTTNSSSAASADSAELRTG